MDWKRKLGSRKLWSLVAAFVTTILVAFNMDANQIAQIVAVIGSFASVVVYMLAEAYVDGKAVNTGQNKEE